MNSNPAIQAYIERDVEMSKKIHTDGNENRALTGSIL